MGNTLIDLEYWNGLTNRGKLDLCVRVCVPCLRVLCAVCVWGLALPPGGVGGGQLRGSQDSHVSRIRSAGPWHTRPPRRRGRSARSHLGLRGSWRCGSRLGGGHCPPEARGRCACCPPASASATGPWAPPPTGRSRRPRPESQRPSQRRGRPSAAQLCSLRPPVSYGFDPFPASI